MVDNLKNQRVEDINIFVEKLQREYNTAGISIEAPFLIKNTDEINAKFIAGEVTLKKWNKTMKSLAAKYSNVDYDISFPIGNKQDILDIIVCSEAVDYIDFRTSQVEEFYTMDVMGWNYHAWH